MVRFRESEKEFSRLRRSHALVDEKEHCTSHRGTHLTPPITRLCGERTSRIRGNVRIEIAAEADEVRFVSAVLGLSTTRAPAAQRLWHPQREVGTPSCDGRAWFQRMSSPVRDGVGIAGSGVGRFASGSQAEESQAR